MVVMMMMIFYSYFSRKDHEHLYDIDFWKRKEEEEV